MTIIEINAREDGSRNIQSRHGAARVWEDGYIEVPVHLEAAVWATYGWCDLQIEEGALVGITPTERPPEPEPEPSPLDRLEGPGGGPGADRRNRYRAL